MAMHKFEIVVDAPDDFPEGDIQSALVGMQVVQKNFYDNGLSGYVVSADPVDEGPRPFPG